MSSTRRWLVVLVLASVLAAGCSSAGEGEGVADDAGGDTTTTSVATTTESVAAPTDGPAAGDLLSVTEVTVSGLEAWTIRYLSTGVGGELVEVTGLVLAPEGGASGADLVSWTHGTTGVGDNCAPSSSPQSISRAPKLLAQAGYVVTMTDYEGLGTEGTHPYLIGESEARSALDSVRATQQMELASSARFAVAGLSQGGHAALWTGQLAPTYAPDLTLVGVVAAAPAANISDLMQTVGTAAQGFAVLAAVGLAASYDDVSLDDYFSPAAIELMAVVETGCTADVFATFIDIGYDAMVVPESWDGGDPIGPLAERLAQNEAGQADIAAPVLMVQGDLDAIVAREYVEAMQQRYCSMNTNAEYSLYLGGGHVDTIITAIDDVISWLDDRFSAVEPVDGCAVVDPDLEALRAAELTTPSVEGVLLDGQTPAGYDTLLSETTAPRLETCPGTPIFGGRVPVAYSGSVWLVAEGIGPFLDGFVARFASEDEASAAIKAFDSELIACGEFLDPGTTVQGRFTRGVDPGLGDESFASEYSGSLGAVPVNRTGLTVRVGDTIYSTSQTQAFSAADPAVALQALQTILP